MKGVIRPEANKFLSKKAREKTLLSPFLDCGFDCTWANERAYGGTQISVLFLKPNRELVDSYGFEYETLLAYSKYSSIEPRTLRAVDHVYSSDPAKGRVEPMWYFFISEADNATEWVSSDTQGDVLKTLNSSPTPATFSPGPSRRQTGALGNRQPDPILSRCWLSGILPGCEPVIGKELVDLLGGVPHDAPQHVFEILLRIDAQIAAGLDQGEDGGAGLAAPRSLRRASSCGRW